MIIQLERKCIKIDILNMYSFVGAPHILLCLVLFTVVGVVLTVNNT